jgi:hypothetical protein
MIARSHLRHAPAGTRIHHKPCLERGDQTRPDQRRLATAGGADNGQKPGALKLFQELVDLGFAPKKDIGLIAGKGPQPRIRRVAQLGHLG